MAWRPVGGRLSDRGAEKSVKGSSQKELAPTVGREGEGACLAEKKACLLGAQKDRVPETIRGRCPKTTLDPRANCEDARCLPEIKVRGKVNLGSVFSLSACLLDD